MLQNIKQTEGRTLWGHKKISEKVSQSRKGRGVFHSAEKK